jgi:hypothetical protein
MLLIRLSPLYEDQLVQGKLAEDGKPKVQKEIRVLVGEVANRLSSV